MQPSFPCPLATIVTVVAAPAVAAAIVALAIAAFRLRDTTLLAPLLWATVPLILSALPMARGETVQPAFTHIVAATTFCPQLAILGAKRPQNCAWPFVIAAFLGIATGPQLLELVTGNQHLIAIIPTWFYYVLATFGLVNHLPTRLCPAAGFWAAAQLALRGGSIEIAPVLLAVAAILAVVCGGISLGRPAAGWDRVWRDFRDSYGLTWSLRVMERTGALADAANSAVCLKWRGFRSLSADSAPPAGSLPTHGEFAPLETGLRALFGRFVSPQWIDDRLSKA